MKRNFLILAIVFLGVALSTGQTLQEDPGIARMMSEFVAYNKGHQEIRGWRVQILVTTDRRLMENARAKFRARYPDYELLFTHENPFYHLKTGAFLTQSRARPFLRTLQRHFPSAFIVADEIELSEVLIYQ